jgi:hypothetical protein
VRRPEKGRATIALKEQLCLILRGQISWNYLTSGYRANVLKKKKVMHDKPAWRDVEYLYEAGGTTVIKCEITV